MGVGTAVHVKADMLQKAKKNTFVAVAVGRYPSTLVVSYSWTPAAPTVTGSAVTFMGLEDGNHTLLFVAGDIAGNVNSTPDRFDWATDTTPPSYCRICAVNRKPTPCSNSSFPSEVRVGAPFSNRSFEVAVEGWLGDVGGPIASVDVRINASAWIPQQAAAGDGATLRASFGAPADGRYQLQLRPRDAVGNVGHLCATLLLDVDTSPPVAQLTAAAVAGESAWVGGEFVTRSPTIRVKIVSGEALGQLWLLSWI